MTGLLAIVVLIAMAASPLIIDTTFSILRRWLRRRSWTDVPDVALDEPVQAVKRARLRAAPDGSAATLGGLTFGGRYAVEDHARCPRRCVRPGDGCDCGFYAVRPDTEEAVLGGVARRPGSIASVRLEVELSGEVLEYELGYRAERQRVLRVTVPRRCAACARHGALGRAVALTPSPKVLWEPRGPGATGTGSGDAWPVLEPVCERHLTHGHPTDRRTTDRYPADRYPADGHPAGGHPADGHPADGHPAGLRLADVAGLLGTEVRWERADAASVWTDAD